MGLTVALCAICYALGIVGRLFVPSSPLAIKLLSRLVRAEKVELEEAKKAEVAKPKEAAKASAEGMQPGETSTESIAVARQEKSGARKRVSTPAPARQTAQAGA